MLEQNIVPVYRPVQGSTVPVEQIPDPVFSAKLLGDGLAIQAENGIVRSPVDGEIVVLFPSFHAIAIRTSHGLDIMIHIGIDTVELEGEGFTSFVNVGDTVTIGQELIRFDWEKVGTTHSLLTPVLVTNMELVERIEPGAGDVLYSVILKRNPEGRELKGLPISDGIAMGTAVVVQPEYNVNRYVVSDRYAESHRFRHAIQTAKKAMSDLIETAVTRLSAQEVEILSAQELLLEDPIVMEEVLDGIKKWGYNAEAMVWDVMQRWIQEFSAMEDPYMRGRAIDLIDVRDRLLIALDGGAHFFNYHLDADSVLVMDEIPASIAGEPKVSHILGIVTAKGNETSHGSIVARSLGIPVVSGLAEQVHAVQPGDFLIVDGTRGLVIVNAEKAVIAHYQNELERQKEHERELLVWKDKPAVTKDDFAISIGANIGGLADTKRARKFGADEIGLFRTEVLFMSFDHWPEEEEQFEAYRGILEEMNGRPVIFRVLDIGGDKPLPYYLIEEQNPFLGYRGIRVLFDQVDKFRSQLRALYRASKYGPVKIMFPMIHSVEEWRSIKNICEEVQSEVGTGRVPLGIMVETPAAAILIDFFLDDLEFVSIGTNDLTQYTLAVDRQNDRVKELYDPFHPAVLKLIRDVVASASQKGVWVGVCGELAGDERMLSFWIGLGVNELSVNPNRVLSLKKSISELSRQHSQQVVGKLKQVKTREEVLRILDELRLDC
ncbi:phosphoenolpyruvate--protein phosphotransferase [Effusibacillus consociatus]|uniref:Phosphoenolpyruvate-protein phosphotransferase n=1 Tax=Effusibacillus consociatus TaxID=1117041 RepID=A0ABV9Q1Q5_9BACL